MLQFIQTTAWFFSGAAIVAFFQFISRTPWTVGYTARPHYEGFTWRVATLARLGLFNVPVPDVLPRRAPGFTISVNPPGPVVHVNPEPVIPRVGRWRRLRESFRDDLIVPHGTRFLEWLADTRFVVFLVDTSDLVAPHWEFDEWWQFVWRDNEIHVHRGAHRRADVDVPGSNWRSQWAEYVTQDWPTLASSTDDLLHPTDAWDVLRPVICTSRLNDVLRVSPLVGSTSC